MVVGDPERAKVLLTAHYDTCAVLPFPNFITPRSAFWYGIYQLLIVAVIVLVTIVVDVAVMLLFEPPERLMTVLVNGLLLFFLWWMVAGPANRHTANDNTSGVVTLVETARHLPQELRDGVCFVFFDNEEKGLLGSAAFAKRHKAARQKALVLNFDCVGEGDDIQFFPNRKMKSEEVLDTIAACYPSGGGKTTEVVRSFGFYPSDQVNFTRGMGVCGVKRSRLFGYYLSRIHTNRDTVLQQENIDLLRCGTVELLKTLQEKEVPHAG